MAQRKSGTGGDGDMKSTAVIEREAFKRDAGIEMKKKREMEKRRLLECNHPLVQCWYCWTRWRLPSWLPSEPCPKCGSAVKYKVDMISKALVVEAL